MSKGGSLLSAKAVTFEETWVLHAAVLLLDSLSINYLPLLGYFYFPINL